MSIERTNVSASSVRERRVVVTGAAGFIGSTVVDQLLALGADVVGVDDFDPWYDPRSKRSNLTSALDRPNFVLHEADALVQGLAAEDPVTTLLGEQALGLHPLLEDRP